MSMIKYVSGEAWYMKLIKLIMFVIAGAVTAALLRGPVSVWLETQGGIFQIDLTIDIISYLLGFILAYVAIYALREGVKSEWM